MLRDEGITAGGNLIVLTDGDENDNAVQHISTIGGQVQAQGVSTTYNHHRWTGASTWGEYNIYSL